MRDIYIVKLKEELLGRMESEREMYISIRNDKKMEWFSGEHVGAYFAYEFILNTIKEMEGKHV